MLAEALVELASAATTVVVAIAEVAAADIVEDMVAVDIAAMSGLAQEHHFAAIAAAELFVALSTVEFDHLPSVIPPSLRIPLR